MRCEPETDSVTIDLDPDMAESGTCTPLEEHHGVVLVESASSFKSVFVECFEHFSEAAFLQDALGILAQSQTPGLIHFTAQYTF